MGSLTYAGSEYNSASGTRDAFGRFSDDLVAAGLPPARVVSGDRSPAVQVGLFVARFRQQAAGVGPYGDVRWWNGSAWGYPGGTRWVRHSSAGTVAVPGTGNHEKKRSNDLGWPYNAVTTAHLKAREIAKRHNITCDGLGFGEPWHWTYGGPIGSDLLSGGNATPIEEDDMYTDADRLRDEEIRAALLNGIPGRDLSRGRLDQVADAVFDLQKRFIVRDAAGNPMYDLTQLAANEIKPMLLTLLAAIGRPATGVGGPVDVAALAAAIREGLEDDIVDELARRLTAR